MTRDPWAPDPEQVAKRTDALRRALATARKAGASETVLENLRAEIQHCEQVIAQPPERKPMDPLTYQTLVRFFSQRQGHSMDDVGPQKAKRTSLEEITGLPLFVPNVPTGLPPEEEETLEAGIWTEMFEQWCETLASRWKLHEDTERAAVSRVASDWSCSPKEVKVRFVRLGLLDAMASAGERWRGRIGSGKGSGKVEAVPADAGPIGALKWLAQVALSCAGLRLQDEDYVVHPLHEELPRDPESGRELEFPSPEWIREGDRFDFRRADPNSRGPSPLDSILAEETARERLAEVYDSARGKEAQKLDALRIHLEQGKDYREARLLAARDLGVDVNVIDLTISRFRKRILGASQ